MRLACCFAPVCIYHTYSVGLPTVISACRTLVGCTSAGYTSGVDCRGYSFPAGVGEVDYTSVGVVHTAAQIVIDPCLPHICPSVPSYSGGVHPTGGRRTDSHAAVVVEGCSGYIEAAAGIGVGVGVGSVAAADAGAGIAAPTDPVPAALSPFDGVGAPPSASALSYVFSHPPRASN